MTCVSLNDDIMSLPDTKEANTLKTEQDIEAEAASKTLTKQQTQDERYSIYTHRQKVAIVLVASISALISPMTQAILLPALNSIAADLHVSNAMINLTLTSFLVPALPCRSDCVLSLLT